jgi:hypothetical protein
MLLLTSNCSGGGEDEQEQALSLTAVDRPIVAIVPAAAIDEDGQPVDPSYVFAPDTPTITIVARAGEVSGSPMDISWTQVAAEGDRELFTHTVEVASFDAAWSVGRSPGLLTPGTYRVEATLEGERLSTSFEVVAGGGTGSAAEGATSGPPVSGDHGMVASPVGDDLDTTGNSLWPHLDHAPTDPDASTIGLSIVAGGGLARVDATVTMGGNSRTQSFRKDSNDLLRVYLRFDPCAHPGGSDLPGAQASFEVILSEEGEGGRTESADFITRLGPDTARPAVTLHAQPPGGPVEEGDRIVFDVTAQEARSGLSWQTGVRELRVVAMPGEDLVPQVRATSDTAQPCDRKQWSLATQGSYTVPEGAPPSFRICPIAIDFAGNRNDDTCATYTTGAGETWQTTIHLQADQTLASGDTCQQTGDATGELLVTSDGQISGTLDVVETEHCSFGFDRTRSGLALALEGTASPSAFTLVHTAGTTAGYFTLGFFTPAGDLDPVPVPITGAGMAQGSVTRAFPNDYTLTMTFELRCLTCEADVG